MSRHRAPVRRSRRWPFALASVLATAAVVTAGVGLMPPQATPGASAGISGATGSADQDDRAAVSRGTSAGRADQRVVAPAVELVAKQPSTALPKASGTGRRAVFSQSTQRVWLVESDGRVLRTYPVSGSVYDNLEPGSYAVFSRSEQAWGIDDSGTMRNFVRFAHGPNAAIGFHDIPMLDGAPVQTEKELGTPLSHGCIRQRSEDALAMWDFAQIGTRVVVV